MKFAKGIRRILLFSWWLLLQVQHIWAQENHCMETVPHQFYVNLECPIGQVITDIVGEFGTLDGSCQEGKWTAACSDPEFLESAKRSCLEKTYCVVPLQAHCTGDDVAIVQYTCEVFVPNSEKFVEEFSSSNPFDLAYSQLTFHQENGLYKSCIVRDVNEFIVDPALNAYAFPLRDDQSRKVSLPKPFTFYGAPYHALYIGSNGYITFIEHDEAYIPTLASHFSSPRISLFYADLVPSLTPGGVRYHLLEDRFVVTYNDVYFYNPFTFKVNFQVELFYGSGDIRITYLNMSPGVFGIVGLSDGLDHPTVTSKDLSATDVCSDANFCQENHCNEKGDCIPGMKNATVCNCFAGWTGVDCSEEATVPPIFLEKFEGDESFDLQGNSLIYTPVSSKEYSLCINSDIESFVNPPSGPNVIKLNLNDDSAYRILLRRSFTFFGVDYQSVFVSSNGYLTFGVPFAHNNDDFFFSWPLVGGLYSDLDPRSGGEIVYESKTDRMVVTFLDVKEFETNNVNSFQFELFYISNVIRVTYLSISVEEAVVGLSNGIPLHSNPDSMDFSTSLAACSLNGKSCDNYDCSQGACTNADNIISCECQSGWAGLHCDIAESVLLFEEFVPSSNPFDLQFSQLTFKSSGSSYGLCQISDITENDIVDPNGEPVALQDNSFIKIELQKPFTYFGVVYNVTYLGSNGYFVFGNGDVHYSHFMDHHLDKPRISGLFSDYDPVEGKVLVSQTSEYILATFKQTSLYNTDQTVSFQMQLFFNTGDIVFKYGSIGKLDFGSLVGISSGFTPTYYTSFDMSDAEDCHHDHENACESNPCQHGSCIPDDATNGYTCICDVHWSGPNCDIEKMQVTFEIYSGINVGDLTNAPIVFVLHGENGDSSQVIPSNTGFTQTVFRTTVDVDYVGKIDSITISTSSEDSWVMEGVRIVTSFLPSEPVWFVSNQRLVYPSNPTITLTAIPEVSYNFNVATASGTNSGTTGHVLFRLNGNTLSTPGLLISPNGFRKGSVEEIVVGGPSVGDIANALLVHQSSDKWDLEWFSVEAESQTFYFEFYATLSRDQKVTITSSLESIAQIPVQKGTSGLKYKSITFSPISSNSYSVCAVSDLIYFPVDYTDGKILQLRDDTFVEVPMSKSFQFFGKSYDSVFVGSNGYLTFGKGDISRSPEFPDHFNLPRISAAFEDLKSGKIYAKELEDRLVVTYYGKVKVILIFSFRVDTQVEIFFKTGVIRISYMQNELNGFIVGLSPGKHPPRIGSYNFESSLPCEGDKLCQANSCGSHGTCINLIDEYRCDCNIGYMGAHCETAAETCEDQPCYHGSCQEQDDHLVCGCDAGWTGPTCQIDIDECAISPCVHGYCLNLENSYSCTCIPGWTGQNCDVETDECENNECVHGTCIDGDLTYTCQCEEGWSGRLCDQMVDYCADNQCVNGACVVNGTSYTCDCEGGWFGTYCDEDANEYFCKNHQCVNGACVANATSDSYLCDCDAGFTGEFCDVVDYCENHECQNDGECVNGEDHYTCECSEEFLGEYCENKNNCLENDCVHGKCVNDESNYTCDCDSGFYGNICDKIDYCNENQCVHGKCENTESDSFQCICDAGYDGKLCDEAVDGCASFECGEHGKCIIQNGIVQCHCSDNWMGAKCDEPAETVASNKLGWVVFAIIMIIVVIGLIAAGVYYYRKKNSRIRLTDEDDIPLI